jgi:hypothetical protein
MIALQAAHEEDPPRDTGDTWASRVTLGSKLMPTKRLAQTPHVPLVSWVSDKRVGCNFIF